MSAFLKAVVYDNIYHEVAVTWDELFTNIFVPAGVKAGDALQFAQTVQRLVATAAYRGVSNLDDLQIDAQPAVKEALNAFWRENYDAIRGHIASTGALGPRLKDFEFRVVTQTASNASTGSTAEPAALLSFTIASSSAAAGGQPQQIACSATREALAALIKTTEDAQRLLSVDAGRH